jgi:hypothetical protein
MKKIDLLRCAGSIRSNVLHEYASGLACPERKPKDRIFARRASRTESYRRADKNKDSCPAVGHGGLFAHQASGAGAESVVFPPADYSAIEGEPSGSKAMDLCLGAACKLSLWRTCLGKMRLASQAPKTTLKQLVSAPSLLQAHPRSTPCNIVTPECFHRGSTRLTTTLSHVEWVGGLVRVSSGFLLKACGNDGVRIRHYAAS